MNSPNDTTITSLNTTEIKKVSIEIDWLTGHNEPIEVQVQTLWKPGEIDTNFVKTVRWQDIEAQKLQDNCCNDQNDNSSHVVFPEDLTEKSEDFCETNCLQTYSGWRSKRQRKLPQRYNA